MRTACDGPVMRVVTLEKPFSLDWWMWVWSFVMMAGCLMGSCAVNVDGLYIV